MLGGNHVCVYIGWANDEGAPRRRGRPSCRAPTSPCTGRRQPPTAAGRNTFPPEGFELSGFPEILILGSGSWLRCQPALSIDQQPNICQQQTESLLARVRGAGAAVSVVGRRPRTHRRRCRGRALCPLAIPLRTGGPTAVALLGLTLLDDYY